MSLKKNIYYGVLVALAAFCAFFGYQTYQTTQKNAELEVQLKDMTEKEKRSVVLQSISTQMEEIANQQKLISDEQREEAVQQTRIANEMRLQSEIEKQNAQEAERNALASERRAGLPPLQRWGRKRTLPLVLTCHM